MFENIFIEVLSLSFSLYQGEQEDKVWRLMEWSGIMKMMQWLVKPDVKFVHMNVEFHINIFPERDKILFK